MKKIKLLFQGDSITDANRNREDIHDLGRGYPLYAARELTRRYPDIDFEFIDLGIGGNQTKDLVERLESDFVEIKADIVSILIGVNDTWHHADERDWIPNEVFEARYRAVLEAVKKTGAKLMMIEPFLIPGAGKDFFREDLDPKIQVERALAREFADVYMPLDGLFAAAYIGRNPLEFAEDGVHPTSTGAEFIGNLYADYIAPIIESL